MALDRAALINGLSQEFDKAKGVDVKIDATNYIDSTNTLDCTANAIPIENLFKTKNVLLQYKEAFKRDAAKNPQYAQDVLHIEIAVKCVEQVIAERNH